MCKRRGHQPKYIYEALYFTTYCSGSCLGFGLTTGSRFSLRWHQRLCYDRLKETSRLSFLGMMSNPLDFSCNNIRLSAFMLPFAWSALYNDNKKQCMTLVILWLGGPMYVMTNMAITFTFCQTFSLYSVISGMMQQPLDDEAGLVVY